MQLATNFSFKDDRTYVHSSTMLEFLSDNVCKELGLTASNVTFDARFHSVATKNGIMLCQEHKKSGKLDNEVAAEFVLESPGGKYFIYFLENGGPVSDRVQTDYKIFDWIIGDRFEASCRVGIDDNHCYLENIIEANKRVHQAAFLGKSVKVINLYMKKAPLALQTPSAECKLSIKHLSSRTHDGGIMTLNRLLLEDINTPAFDVCYFIPGVDQ